MEQICDPCIYDRIGRSLRRRGEVTPQKNVNKLLLKCLVILGILSNAALLTRRLGESLRVGVVNMEGNESHLKTQAHTVIPKINTSLVFFALSGWESVPEFEDTRRHARVKLLENRTFGTH